MVIPAEGRDNLGQVAKATTTFLYYSLELACRNETAARSLGALELIKEELVYIKKGDAHRHLLFKHSASQWRDSVIQGKRSGAPFISTENESGGRIVKLHQDGGSRGKPRSLLATKLPRTVLSDTNASERPTAVLARQEMRSWRLLQLEPTASRKPDEFTAANQLGMDGSHLARSLYYLANIPADTETDEAVTEQQVYAQVTNRLAELLEDVRRVRVDRDERKSVHRLAERIDDFSPLRRLPAFQAFEEEIIEGLERIPS